MVVHFIGICGISMKSLAQLMLKLNHEISGSDISIEGIEYLRKLGINAYTGIDTNVVSRADCVVYSSAIGLDNEELVFAKKKNIKCISRIELIRELENLVSNTIYVCGCHGKSTVTGLICNIFKAKKYGFIGLCGADYKDSESNLIFTGYDYMIAEACEYKKNFLKLNPNCLLVLNIEYDHPDTYKDIYEVYDSFYKLAKNTKKLLIVNENVSELFKDLNAKIITFGNLKTSDYYIEDYKESKDGSNFKIYYHSKYMTTINSKLLGKFNCLNVLAAYILSKEMKIDDLSINSGIEEFSGLKRRFQKISENIIIDYAHHPEEIENTILLAKSIYKGKLFIIFQPHTYSRTINLYKEFYDVFSKYDNVIFIKTYRAREKELDYEPIEELKNQINNNTHRYFKSYQEAYMYLTKCKNKDATYLILGAGDVYKLGYLMKNFMDNLGLTTH